MKRSTTSVSTIALAIVASATVSAQTTFPESEPNSSKTDANVVACMTAGDMITGTTIGAIAGVGNANPDSADYYKISTCALPLAIYEHTLTFTTSTPGNGGSVRGLSQSGTPGSGGTPVAGSDVVAQNGGVTQNLQKWYGFGKSETLFVRRTGTAATTGMYTDTLSTATITPTVIGPFVPGSITINSAGQGHATDTDLWVYDATLTAIPTFGSDDPYPVPGVYGQPAALTRTFAAGTYYLAISTWNVTSDQPAPSDEFAIPAVVMDFPDVVLESVDIAAVPANCAFAVTDSAGTTMIAATKTLAMEILWYKFDVASPTPGIAICEPGAAGVLACQCGNPNGAGVGCSNTGSSGADLASTGFASLAADATNPGSVTLTGTSMLSGSSCIYLQGDGVVAAGTPFGAGIRCAGGTLKRLYVKSLVGTGGTKTAPEAADPSISNRSAALGDTIPSSGVRYYQIYYRDPGLANPGGGCPPAATFNVTTAQQITWGP